MIIKDNPCEEHLNVLAPGFCPVCLAAERNRYRERLDVLVEAQDRVTIMGEVGHVSDYMDALADAREALEVTS